MRETVSGSNLRAMTTYERRMLQEQDSSTTPTREELLDTLRAVRDAIDVPHAATMGEQEVRDRILIERVGHVAVGIALT